MEELPLESIQRRERALAAQLRGVDGLQVGVTEPIAVKADGVHQRWVGIVALEPCLGRLRFGQHLAGAIEDSAPRQQKTLVRDAWVRRILAQIGRAPDLPVAQRDRDQPKTCYERKRRAPYVLAHVVKHWRVREKCAGASR